MKMRILHIVHSLQVGGLENGLVNLINRLDEQRFEHIICCVADSGPMASRLEKKVEIHSLGKGTGRDNLLPLKIARLVRQVKPDLVHTRNWGTIDGIIGARLAGVRKVVHGEHGRDATTTAKSLARRQRVLRFLSPLLSACVAVSGELHSWLVDEVGVPLERAVQIINGVDAEKFSPCIDKSVARRKFGIEEEAFVVGIVGRLDPVKDHTTLLKAFAGLDAKCHLLIIGGGPLEQQLMTLAMQLNCSERVIFTGERDDIPQLLQTMDVFVLPSLTEGISNTILEAMACAVPVVASRVAGNSELVSEGVTGELFEVGDNDSLTLLLESYREAPELSRSHGRCGREEVEKRFSLQRMTQDYADLYNRLLHTESW